MPPRTTEFAVGDRMQADVLLLLDDLFDSAVFGRLEIGVADLVFGVAFASFFQLGGTQQAADMVGAERRLSTLHYSPHTSRAISAIIRSFAHSSSSASVLPSSVEAKPHCGDRQSWSMSMNFAASSIRRLSSSFFSSVPVLVVTRP